MKLTVWTVGNQSHSYFWTRFLRELKQLKVWWKCFFRASPSHKPQQLSSTAPGMCRKGCSVTTAEVRSTPRSGRQHQDQLADFHTELKIILSTKRCKKSNQLLKTCPLPLPLTALPLWFHLHFRIYLNWVSQNVCQHATFILPGLWFRGQISIPYSAT